MPEFSALVTAIAAAVVGSVVAAMIPSVRRWVGALFRLCVLLGRSLLTKARSRGDAPTATEPTGDDTTMIHPDPKEPTGRAARFRAALTDRDGVASLDLHSTHLPMTVFAAAEGCAAHAETGWIPAGGALAVELFPLSDGGSMVINAGTGHIPGLTGRLNPIRDMSDRTYLYADNVAINGGQPQPVSFAPGDEQMQLVDANGNEFLVRVVAIIGRSSLLEYNRCPARHSVQQDDPDTQVSISLSSRVAEGASEEAEKQRRSLEAWIVWLVKGALKESSPLGGGLTSVVRGRWARSRSLLSCPPRSTLKLNEELLQTTERWRTGLKRS